MRALNEALRDRSTTLIVSDGSTELAKTMFRASIHITEAAPILHAKEGGGQNRCSAVCCIDHEERPQSPYRCINDQTLVTELIGDNVHTSHVPTPLGEIAHHHQKD